MNHNLEPDSGKTQAIKSDYECLWIPITVTFMQLLPRIDLNLCVNKRGEIALIGLPDLAVVCAVGQVKREQPQAKSSAVFVQRIHQGRDESHLSPVAYTDELFHKIYDMVKFDSAKGMQPFDWMEILRKISKVEWRNIIPEVEAHNMDYFINPKNWQKLSRLKINDNVNFMEPDDVNTINEYLPKVPVFIYLLSSANHSMSRSQLERELGLRLFLSRENRKAVREKLCNLMGKDISDYDPLVGVIARVEAELRIQYETKSPIDITLCNLLLNSEMSDFVIEPEQSWTLSSKGQAEINKILRVESGNTMYNFGEENIVHIGFHIGQSQGKSVKDTIISPSIFIFKDELGIHTAPTYIFQISCNSFDLMKALPRQIMNIDELPVEQIPEVEWAPVGEEVSGEWWQTQKIARKVLWLITRYLASHLVENPEKVIYSVTPIGDDAIQVAPLFDKLEDASAYAFVIIRNFRVALKNRNLTDNNIVFDTAIVGVPIFQLANYKIENDGSMTSTKGMLKKDYCITDGGLRAFGPVLEFVGPVYSTILVEKYKSPRVYELGRPSTPFV